MRRRAPRFLLFASRERQSARELRRGCAWWMGRWAAHTGEIGQMLEDIPQDQYGIAVALLPSRYSALNPIGFIWNTAKAQTRLRLRAFLVGVIETEATPLLFAKAPGEYHAQEHREQICALRLQHRERCSPIAHRGWPPLGHFWWWWWWCGGGSQCGLGVGRVREENSNRGFVPCIGQHTPRPGARAN